jgi:predicted hotdog family 3-hydroxylacyl-ACP dehydratase
MNFPVAVEQLENWLPHRAPAVWIDEVSWVKADEGECRVRLKADANYMDPTGNPRDSSFVEWMAQAYGYVGACQIITGLVSAERPPSRTFLAHVRDFERSTASVQPEDVLQIHVRKTHQLGPLLLIEGKVTQGDRALAQAKLKLFAE